ncbi:MAG: FAD-dependent oxidoreductase [Candidatus Paceibacteria bacterium]
MQTYNTKLKEKNQLTDNIISAKFSRPKALSFSPGQYVQFFIPEHNTTRSYSICSTPSDDILEFCVKLYKSGVGSNFFKNLNTGDEAKIRGPLGRFTVSKTNGRHIFIAAGVGIAPIISMIRAQLDKDNQNKYLKLLFGLSQRDDIFYRQQLKDLSNKSSNFNFEITLSRQENNWQGKTGRVTDHLDQFDLNSEFYICGSREMVKDTENKLINLGASAKKINFEIF